MLVKYKITITDQAFLDVRVVGDYITERLLSVDIANSWLEGLILTITTLQYMPQRNKKIELINTHKMEVRYIQYNNHLIFYNIDDKNKYVYVLRVLYKMQNWKEIL